MNKTFGPIYAKASNNKIKMWSANVTDNILSITHGYTDGKQVTDTKEVSGKNLGKKNETSPFKQACSDAQSKYNKKIDEGYMVNLDDVAETSIELPMLALNFRDRAHDIIWPAYASPKLDGNRLLAKFKEDNKLNYLSRKGKEFSTLSHLDNDVNELLNHISFSDGELYVHNWALQDIAAASKKLRPETSQLEYWVFDVPNKDLVFESRYSLIKSFFDSKETQLNEQGFRKFGQLVEVPNYEINNIDELQTYHDQFIKMGFEGTMIRNKNGLYKFGHRSADLQKKKDFLEDEFKIIGGKSAEGNDIGTVVFRCITKEGKEFDVRPKGTREQRKEWLDNIDSLINKDLTVRFQYFSNDLVPCHNRGICIRDYE